MVLRARKDCVPPSQVLVEVSAAKAGGGWHTALAMPPMAVVVSRNGAPVMRAMAEATDREGTVDDEITDAMSVVAPLPVGLEVDESYTISAEMPGLAPGQAPLGKVSDKVLVRAGRGPQRVSLVAERTCGSISIKWASASMGADHWANALPLPEGFMYRGACATHYDLGTTPHLVTNPPDARGDLAVQIRRALEPDLGWFDP